MMDLKAATMVVLLQNTCKMLNNKLLLLQDSVKKKMSGLTLPPMPRLPSKAKFWKKRSSSANISDYDPTFRVIYLGNVLTGWAKGKQSYKLT